MAQLEAMEVVEILYTPLRKLKAPGIGARERRGLRRLPPWCNRLQLLYALDGLEGLIDSEPRETVRCLVLALRALAALGGLKNREPSVQAHLAGVIQAIDRLWPEMESLYYIFCIGEDAPDLTLSPRQERAAEAYSDTLLGVLDGCEENLQWNVLRALSHLFETSYLSKKMQQEPAEFRAARGVTSVETTILRKLACGCFLNEVGDLHGG